MKSSFCWGTAQQEGSVCSTQRRQAHAGPVPDAEEVGQPTSSAHWGADAQRGGGLRWAGLKEGGPGRPARGVGAAPPVTTPAAKCCWQPRGEGGGGGVSGESPHVCKPSKHWRLVAPRPTRT